MLTCGDLPLMKTKIVMCRYVKIGTTDAGLE